MRKKRKISTDSRASTIKVAPEKVPNMVGTFLTDDDVTGIRHKSGTGKGYQYGGNLFD